MQGKGVVDVEKIVHHAAAAHIADADGIAGDPHLLNGLRQKAVGDTVAAAGAVGKILLVKRRRPSKYLLFH